MLLSFIHPCPPTVDDSAFQPLHLELLTVDSARGKKNSWSKVGVHSLASPRVLRLVCGIILVDENDYLFLVVQCLPL